MVAFIDSNSVLSFASRARPCVQGSTFAAKHRTVHQEPSLTRSVSHFKARQGKSTSSPKRLHRVDHSNQQYSILAITDTSGAVVERVAYQAYGQPTFTNATGTTQSSSAKAIRYSYTGREWDPSLELHHFRARWMSGVSGRFLNRDPIGFFFLSQLNLFGFLRSNPYRDTDSTGLCADAFTTQLRRELEKCNSNFSNCLSNTDTALSQCRQQYRDLAFGTLRLMSDYYHEIYRRSMAEADRIRDIAIGGCQALRDGTLIGEAAALGCSVAVHGRHSEATTQAVVVLRAAVLHLQVELAAFTLGRESACLLIWQDSRRDCGIELQSCSIRVGRGGLADVYDPEDPMGKVVK